MPKHRHWLRATLLAVPLVFSSIGCATDVGAPARDVSTLTAKKDIISTTINPAIWALSDEDTTIYLFGTIHALRPDDQWLTPEITAAFDRSDELILEILLSDDIPTLQKKISQYAALNEGERLSELLTPEMKQSLQAILARHQQPIEVLESFQPWYAATMISMLPLLEAGFAQDQGVEAQLQSRTKASGKKVAALETIDQQFQIFSDMSRKQQLLYLDQTLSYYDESLAMVDELVRLWRAGEEEALGELMNQSLEEAPDLAHALLCKRNENWAAQLKQKLLQPGAIFVAVGAGHLSGECSVQDELAKLGLKTSRLKTGM